MLNMLKQAANRALTENGAATRATTGSDCLDLFASIGALRRETDDEIIARFVRAYTENADLAMKLLFYARDIRGGLGERRVFRTVLTYLAKNEPESVRKNLVYIAEYGRFDDLLSLLGTPCENAMLHLVRKQFEADMECLESDSSVSLLAKWLPSVNASSAATIRNAKRIARALGLRDCEYRRNLVRLRARIRIIENNLRERDYSFDYAKQPSRAMLKYKHAFLRNDGARYSAYMADVLTGKAKLHADNVAPYELIAPYLRVNWYYEYNGFMRDISPEEKAALNATWASLPDYGGDENVLAVVDTSGSMYSALTPFAAAVALSLGLYFAEHNRGVFKKHFIEFSAEPQLIEIKGETFADRLRYVSTFTQVADTNLEAVFDLILRAAVEHHARQEELPAKLIILSDMEFNACVHNASETNFNNAKKKFAAQGYRLPEIIFWNVASRNRHQPVTMDERGVALVSGVTPRLFSMIIGGALSPCALMLDVLESDRYAPITA